MKSSEIKKQLLRHWPRLKHLWMTAREYHLPELEEIKDIVGRQEVRNIPFRKNVFECEGYARALHSAVEQHWAKNMVWSAPVAFGLCLGPRVETSIDPVHALNITITTEGVYLVEPQTYQVFKPKLNIREKDRNFIFKVDL